MRGWLLQPTPSSYVSLSSCRMTLLSHHDLLLDNLALTYKYLIYKCDLSRTNIKVTNRKQKNHLLQKETFKLRFVNAGNKGKYPILSFGEW